MSRQPTVDEFRIKKPVTEKGKPNIQYVSENGEVSPPLASLTHYDKNGHICDMKNAVAFSMRVDGKKKLIYKILMASGTPVDISNARLPRNRQLEVVSEEVFTLYMQYLLRRQFHDYEKTVRAHSKTI
jgi:hypothetical protein